VKKYNLKELSQRHPHHWISKILLASMPSETLARIRKMKRRMLNNEEPCGKTSGYLNVRNCFYHIRSQPPQQAAGMRSLFVLKEEL
jgi:hypothetical protein